MSQHIRKVSVHLRKQLACHDETVYLDTQTDITDTTRCQNSCQEEKRKRRHSSSLIVSPEQRHRSMNARPIVNRLGSAGRCCCGSARMTEKENVPFFTLPPSPRSVPSKIAFATSGYHESSMVSAELGTGEISRILSCRGASQLSGTF